MHNYIQNVIDWAFNNDLLLNGNKTKEMVGPYSDRAANLIGLICF